MGLKCAGTFQVRSCLWLFCSAIDRDDMVDKKKSPHEYLVLVQLPASR